MTKNNSIKLIFFLIVFLATIQNAHAGFLDSIKNFFGFSLPTAGQGTIKEKIPKEVLTKLRKSKQCSDHYSNGIHLYEDAKTNTSSFYFCFTDYALQYNPDYTIPMWASETLSAKKINGQYNPPAKFGFKQLKFLPSNYQPHTDIISASGKYISQPLAMLETSRWSINAMVEKSYAINTVPMIKNNLSNTIWAQIEQRKRIWAVRRGRGINNITGVIFYNNEPKEVLTDGKVNVYIPTHFFSILTDPSSDSSIAFIVPNREIATTDAKNLSKDAYYCKTTDGQKKYCDINDFVTGIKEVERIAKIDINSTLGEQIKNTIESINPVGDWKY